MGKEKEKVKKAMQSGRNEIAAIHASNAIMQKNQVSSRLCVYGWCAMNANVCMCLCVRASSMCVYVCVCMCE